ncbi:MAG: TlpA disulfide reductase family protein, partial [Thermoguttaceae bacterium]
VLASIVLLISMSTSLTTLEAADTSTKVLEGVHWAGPSVTLEGLHGKTVVLIDYATWCPICNKWSGEVCRQIKEAITDKPVVVLAINTDQTLGNVRPYLEARDFLAPNIVHGYDPSIAKRNALPDLWGYMIIDPEGKIVEKGHVGSYSGGDANKVFVLPKKLQEQTTLGEFIVIDPKMADTVKNALWPMELGVGTSAELRKFKGEQKQQVDAALAKYGEKELEKIHELAVGDVESQFAAYDCANALGLQLKGSDSAKLARKAALALEADPKFKRELAAKKAYERCEKTPAITSRATALKTLIKRFEGTIYANKAKEAVESAGLSPKAAKQ